LDTSVNHIKADLHTHTNYSDGICTPVELIHKAKAAGLSHLAITDHDNVDAVEEALGIGKEVGVEIIPGMEISADHNGREVHILGYFFDHKNSELLDYLKNFRIERIKRAGKIVGKLNELGIAIKIEDVLAKAKGEGSVGRPHIANTMLEHKYIEHYYEAFNKFIGDGKKAYFKKPNIAAHDAIKLIAKCGGLSFIAHPGKNIREQTLIELIEFGIDGIETLHPSHSPADMEYFRTIAGQYFLLESGGSDYHGGNINDDSILGHYFITEQKITAMKNRLFNN